MSEESPTPHYRWPYFLLAAVVLAVVLAVVWVNHEVRRTRRIQQLNAPTPTMPETNRSGGAVE
jgi:hypothetical protein